MSNIEEWVLFTNDEYKTNLANIVVFNNSDKAVVSWCGKIKSIVVYDSLEDFKKISLNSNRKLVEIKQKFQYQTYNYDSTDNYYLSSDEE